MIEKLWKFCTFINVPFVVEVYHTEYMDMKIISLYLLFGKNGLFSDDQPMNVHHGFGRQVPTLQE